MGFGNQVLLKRHTAAMKSIHVREFVNYSSVVNPAGLGLVALVGIDHTSALTKQNRRR